MCAPTFVLLGVLVQMSEVPDLVVVKSSRACNLYVSGSADDDARLGMA